MKAIEQLEHAPNMLARNFRRTDRKSLLAFRAVGPESEAESVCAMRAELQKWARKSNPRSVSENHPNPLGIYSAIAPDESGYGSGRSRR